MSRMIRKQLYLEPRQERLLKRVARERGVTEAEVVRGALDQAVSSPQGVERAEFSRASKQAWQRSLAFMKSLLDQGPLPAASRDWTREDIYEERLSRYERRNPR